MTPTRKQTHKDRSEVGDSPFRSLYSTDFAPSTKRRHEDGDHRSNRDDLVCANLHLRRLQSDMVVELHHRRFVLGFLSESVAWVGRSARDAVDTTSRGTVPSWADHTLVWVHSSSIFSWKSCSSAPPSICATITGVTGVSIWRANSSQKCPFWRFTLSFLTA